MASPKKAEHVHKLKRHIYNSNNRIYFCILPDCNYKVDVPLSLGKKIICNRCGNQFIMNERSIRLKFPHCDNCSRKRVVDESTGAITYISQDDVSKKVFDKVADNHVNELKNRLSAIVKTSDVTEEIEDEI